MRIRTVTLAGIILTSIILAATAGLAAVKTLSVIPASGTDEIVSIKGETFDVVVEVDAPANIAGASFTISYIPTDVILNSVESAFFGTFVNQSIPTPNDQGYVTVDTVDYPSPLVNNAISTGTMIAAARASVENILESEKTLFTLHFETLSDAPVGSTEISIVPSVINNTDAGYSADGEAIDLLIGIDPDNSYPAHTVSTIIPCIVNIEAAFVDTDFDEIDDNWEIRYFGNLTTATATSDFDKDGYTDLQEYLNYVAGETDLLSALLYDPTTQNAPDGTGYAEYVATRIALPAVNLLLLSD